MALKDLMVSHAALTEEQIEKIVRDFARYDSTARTVVLLPSAMSLSSRQRVIVYLVALRGWPFVLPEDSPTASATPGELERSLQIPGGTLRRMLKELKDARLIENTDGRYSANPVTFQFLEEQLRREGTSESAAERPISRARTKAKSQEAVEAGGDSARNAAESYGDADRATIEPSSEESKRRGRRDATVAGGGPLGRLRELIGEGWFSQPRTTKDIVTELAARGASYRGQDLTRQLVTLTRSKELRRSSRPRPGSARPVWHYQI